MVDLSHKKLQWERGGCSLLKKPNINGRVGKNKVKKSWADGGRADGRGGGKGGKRVVLKKVASITTTTTLGKIEITE